MTISYAEDISNGSGTFTFMKLLVRRWKGSLYRLVYLDLMGYIFMYYFINFIYRFALHTPDQKRKFEEIVKYCDHMKTNIPISFLLGFFVSGVVARWYKIYLLIPWLNRTSFLIEGMVNGGDLDLCRRLRQTLLRYLNLSYILCMREVSEQIEIRFRKHDAQNKEEFSLRDTFINFNRDDKIKATYRKIITDSEIQAFEKIAAMNWSKYKIKYVPEFWVPIQWASRLLQKAFVHGYICDPRTLNSLINDLDGLRSQMHTLQRFSGILIPLVYTQVITIAVYSYFLCQIFASQFIDPRSNVKGHEVDMYIPLFSIFQFLFFMGWLKVAMCVMNPFGDDDEDFQTSDFLDYNLDVTFRSVTADSLMYPEHLDPPKMSYIFQKNSEEDFLDQFMKDIDGDLEEIDAPNSEGDVTALEVKPTRCIKFIRKITFGLCYSVTPKPSSPPNCQPWCRNFFRKKRTSFHTQLNMYPEPKRGFHKGNLTHHV